MPVRPQQRRRHGQVLADIDDVVTATSISPSSGEADAQQLAHRAAAAVAAAAKGRTQVRAVGQLGGHPVLVLTQPDQFAAAPNIDTESDGELAATTGGTTGAVFAPHRERLGLPGEQLPRLGAVFAPHPGSGWACLGSSCRGWARSTTSSSAS